MRLVEMILDFFKKYRQLKAKDRAIIQNIRKDISRKQEFRRDEGFLPVSNRHILPVKFFIYEPAKDSRLNKLRLTGPYFRVWFTEEKDGKIYFVDFEKLD